MEEIIKTFGIDWKLLLVQMINFGILLFILQYFLYKPIMKMIDERKGVLEKGVKDAKEAEESLRVAKEEGSEILNKNKKEAREYLESAKSDSLLMKEKAVKEAEVEKEKILKEASISAKRIEEEAISKSKQALSQMSILAAEKILKEKN